MYCSDHFKEAVIDYFYLVQKGYPPRGFLQLVGDRYHLASQERTMLYRGIVPEIVAKIRKLKAINQTLICGQELFIDGFNVILTISAYLLGLPLFMANDGFLRDASALRGKINMQNKLMEAINLLVEFTETINTEKIHIFLDQKVKIHQEILKLLLEIQKRNFKIFELHISDNVDKELKSISSGIVCTSDSGIIESCNSPLFDLAFHVIKTRFCPQILNLHDLIFTSEIEED